MESGACSWLASSGFRVDVLRPVRPVERDRLEQALAKLDGGRPAGRVFEFARVGVETADIDRLLIRRPLHVLDAAGSGDLDQKRRELAMADGPLAADVEHFAVARFTGARPQERVSRVVDVDEVAQLRAVAEDLNRPVLDGEADEP